MKNKRQKIRDRQLCIIPGWMLRFGFDIEVLVILALIHGFTENCGGFIYDPVMLREWTGKSISFVEDTLDNLEFFGAIEVIKASSVTVIRTTKDLKETAMNCGAEEEEL